MQTIRLSAEEAKKTLSSSDQFETTIDGQVYQITRPVFEGLIASIISKTIDCCKNNNAQFILRGIRYINDFEYEKAIADMNRMLAPEVETVFLTCTPLYSTISSTLVRDVIRNNGNVHQFIPDAIVQDFKTIS